MAENCTFIWWNGLYTAPQKVRVKNWVTESLWRENKIPSEK